MFTAQRTSLSSVAVPLVVASLAVLALCGGLYLREANQTVDAALDRENRRMEIFTGLFASDIASAVSDLRLLATGDGLQSYLTTGRPEDLQRGLRRAQFFSRDNPDYDQIRFLDENGMEIIRVNRGGVVVPPGQLQNKASRPYFQEAIPLAPGQIYLSPIDLNVEHGVIEQPFNPTLRLAMPVFDAVGRKRGVYVINYRVENSIQRLRDFVPQYAPRFRLLNSQGYWLASPDPRQEWGFMFPAGAGATLAKTEPSLWAKIAAHPSGQEPYHGGYFTWKYAQPKNFAPGKPVELVSAEPFLVFASELSRSEYQALLASLRQTFVVVAFVLLVLTVVTTWILQTRRRAQQERDRFFSLTRDMLCIAGFDGYFKRLNPAWEATFGFTAQEILDQPFLDLIHPEDREKTRVVMQELANGNEIVSFENRYRCKDGSYRWLLWSARPLPHEGLIYASARDMTERKQIEEKLRQNEQRSRSIIESAHDAFVSIDIDGRIKDWNLRAEKIFGWARAEVIGRLLHETIIPARYRDAHIRGMKHLRDTGEGPVLNKTLEISALRRNGEEFPIEFVIWPLRLGAETTFHAFVRDITLRKENEENIRKLNDQLQERATLLETANKELESFSYSVFHDLRAPLRHIHGFVELLQSTPAIGADASAQRYMGVISRAAREMGRLIDDLLAFSRTSRAELRPVQIDLRDIVDPIVAERALECKDRHILWDIQPMDPVAGDPSLLRLVWTNLIDNALKYTRPRPEARIEIGQLPSHANGASRERTFYIRDNGVGFDMQYASKLFGVFQRLHRPEDFEGTGIGLANVQRIIHRHGGRVWAESKVDAGATFYFTLPVPVKEAKRASPSPNHAYH